MQEQQTSIYLHKTEGKRLDQIFWVLSNQGSSTILYRINEKKNKGCVMRQVLSWNIRRKICFLLHSGKQTLQMQFMCLGTTTEGWKHPKILLLCFFFSKYNWRKPKEIQKTTVRLWVRTHKITKEPLDRQEQIIKYVSDSRIYNVPV